MLIFFGTKAKCFESVHPKGVFCKCVWRGLPACLLEQWAILLEIKLTPLIQGSYSFLTILTEQGTTSERHVCVLPAQGCVKKCFMETHEL